ncbi:MAG: hypothetical protein ACI8P9_000578 [Parasphingorhabdus sp.]|jgi:hypothetical protein
MNYRIQIIVVSVLLLTHNTLAMDPPEDALTLSIYKMEVLSYCGLIDNRVSQGFKQERDFLITKTAADDTQIAKARSDAWQAGLAEWQNRGLGGFKNWCRTEGIEAQQYFWDITD